MDGPEAVGVRAVVVITPRKGNKAGEDSQGYPADALRRHADDVQEPVRRAQFEGTGRMAVFPLDALSEENEVHVIYERKVMLTSRDPAVRLSCEDCDVKFSSKNIR